MGKQETTHKSTYLAQAQSGPAEAQKPELIQSKDVTQSQHVSILQVAQSHVLSGRKHTVAEQSATLLEPAWPQVPRLPHKHVSLRHLVNPIYPATLADPGPKSLTNCS